MALTLQDLQAAAFGASLQDLQDVALANMGLEDISKISLVHQAVSLNLSFNQLSSLTGVERLRQLQLLNVTHNTIKSLRPLSELTWVTTTPDVALTAAQLANTGAPAALQVLKASHNRVTQLAVLAGCSSLKELWLQHNPVTGLAQVAALQPVTALQQLWLQPCPLHASLGEQYRPAVVSALPSLQGLDGVAITESDRDAAEKYAEQAAAATALQAQAQAQGPEHPAAPRSQAGGLPAAAAHRGRKPACPKVPAVPGASSMPPREASAEAGSSVPAERTGGPAKAATRGQRRGPAAGASPVVDDGQGFASVSQQLPTFAIDRHGNRVGKPLDPYGTAHLKGTIRTHVPQQAPTATYQEFYGQARIHQAIIVRSDGSAVAQYPSGDGIAVAVDLEHSEGKAGWRIYATYRSTGMMALAFEADGTGSAQWQNGSLRLSVTAETGKGALYDHSGAPVRTWSTGSGDAGLPEPICLQLDEHLGLCYRGPGTLEVFFACEGHFQKLVQGPNPAQHVWEEPGSEGCPDFVKEMMVSQAAVPLAVPQQAPAIQPRGTAFHEVGGPSNGQILAINAALETMQADLAALLGKGQAALAAGEAASDSATMAQPETGGATVAAEELGASQEQLAAQTSEETQRPEMAEASEEHGQLQPTPLSDSAETSVAPDDN